MEFIAILGFLIFAGSLVYLAAHGIMKLNHPSRVLPKKKFYPFLIGGFLVCVLGVSMVNGTKAELDEIMKSNAAFAAENDKLNSKVKELEKEKENDIEQIKSMLAQIEAFEAESEKISKKTEELLNAEKALTEKEASYKTEIEELRNTITELQSENSSLKGKVNSLEGQLSTASVNETESSKAYNQSSTGASSRDFANCTELRTVHPRGVSSDHPDYQPSMDRDKDGWACER